MESITYVQVFPNTEEFAALQSFAETFDHTVRLNPHSKYFVAFRGLKPIGYQEQVFTPVIYPAFHPDECSPRDVTRVMHDWVAHSQLSGVPAIVGVPLNNRKDSGNFPEETMNRLGLVRLQRELYAPK